MFDCLASCPKGGSVISGKTLKYIVDQRIRVLEVVSGLELLADLFPIRAFESKPGGDEPGRDLIVRLSRLLQVGSGCISGRAGLRFGRSRICFRRNLGWW